MEEHYLTGGPYIQAALFCDRALQESDGTLSAIRIVDRFTQHAPGMAPAEMPPMMVETTIMVCLKPGEARGRYALKIRPEAPSGHQLPALETPVHFEGGDGSVGINLVLPLRIQLDEEGLYWFDVLWVDRAAEGDVLLTRMPLRVVYQPQATQSG